MDSLLGFAYEYISNHPDIITGAISTLIGMKVMPDRWLRYFMKAREAVDALDQTMDRVERNVDVDVKKDGTS